MKVKPIGDRVLIEVKMAEEKTTGGIVIPQTAQEKTQEGKIIAVGTGEKINVAVGNSVIFEKYSGTQIKIDGKDCLILKIEDVLAVIE